MTFLTDIEVSAMINVKVNTLRTWRRRGDGPNYIKAEGKRGAIRYESEEIMRWIEASRERGKQN